MSTLIEFSEVSFDMHCHVFFPAMRLIPVFLPMDVSHSSDQKVSCISFPSLLFRSPFIMSFHKYGVLASSDCFIGFGLQLCSLR